MRVVQTEPKREVNTEPVELDIESSEEVPPQPNNNATLWCSVIVGVALLVGGVLFLLSMPDATLAPPPMPPPPSPPSVDPTRCGLCPQ